MEKTIISDAALITSDIQTMSFADKDEANYILNEAYQNDISTIFIVEDGHTEKGDLGYVAEIEKIGYGKFTCHIIDSFKITSFNRESDCFGDVEGIA